MSSYIERLIEQAEAGWDWDAELADLTPPEPTEDHAVGRDFFDRMEWSGMHDSIDRLRQEIDRVAAEHPQAPPAFEDLFNLLYQGDPTFVEAEQMLPEFLANLDLLQGLAQTEEFKMLQDQTRYDAYSAVFAVLEMEDQLRRAFESVKDKREAQQQAAQAAQEAAQGLAEALAQGQQGEALDGAVQAAQQAAADQAKAAADHATAQRDAMNNLTSGATQAKSSLDEEDSMMGGYGVGDGDLQKMSFQERQALAKKMRNSRLKKFAAMLGQHRPFADAERRHKVKHAPAEVHDFTLGNDLTKLVPSQMQMLAMPETEELFWLRYVRRELLVKEVRGEEHLGQGPIVVVCDESLSMDAALDVHGNTREAWSKAVSLALCDQAKASGRDFTYIGFASERQQVRIDFPGGRSPIEKVLEFTEHFFSGGTHYERPLTMALETIAEHTAAGRDRADIVFITDDECRVPAAFIEAFRTARTKAEAKVYGIQIGRTSLDNALTNLCDRVISITKLNAGPEGVRDLYRQI